MFEFFRRHTRALQAILVLLIAFITISLQTIKAAKTNPVNVLRTE